MIEQMSSGTYVKTFSTVGIPKIMGSLMLNTQGTDATLATLLSWELLQKNSTTSRMAK